MSNIFIFILVFNGLCFAQNFDKYKTSDQQTFDLKYKLDPIKMVSASASNNVHINREGVSNEEKSEPVVTEEKKVDIKKEQTDIGAKSDTKTKNTDKEVHNSTNATTEKKELNNSKEDHTKDNNFATGKPPPDHQGALLRAFYVFVGISSLLILYFVFKSFRLRPGAPPPATVRKYGVVGRRSDMEMLPLPLAEEEDDDTLFEVNTNTNR